MAIEGNGNNEQRPVCFNGPLLPENQQDLGGDNQANQSRPMDLKQEEAVLDRAEGTVYGPPNIDEASAPTSTQTGQTSLLAITAPPSTSWPLITESLDENNHRYVGLVNQAMTCYLNSLIQSLYMTPEFRNAIYSWKFSGSESAQAKNIPFQLQKLFLMLQTGVKSSLETKELTTSFGWESGDAYDQHDVQELCRIMFDALEHKWRNTENSSIIQDLYKGTIQDYVKCLRCLNERVKEDVFLDLPLAIKPYGKFDSYRSIEEALKAFIKPEVLNENNQYECETCRSKQDAEKGLRITAFPYLLTIQLKRFDFDYATLHRMKLNDRITFPDFLDINEFVYTPKPKLSFADVTKKQKSEEQSIDYINYENNSSESQWHDVSKDSKVVNEMLQHGTYVYELFSVMVHQGSASAGHYYAFIKNLDQNKWFSFNDSIVSPASIDEIMRTYGVQNGFGLPTMSNTNAYMLMYRKVDASRNKSFLRSNDLSPHLIDLKRKIEEDEKKRAERIEYERSLIKINYKYNEAPYVDLHEPYSLVLSKGVSLMSLFSEIMESLAGRLKTDFSVDEFDIGDHQNRSRLISCEKMNDIWEMQRYIPIDEKSDETVESLLDNRLFGTRDLYILIDTKPSAEFEFYNFPDNISHARTFKIYLVNIDDESIVLAKLVCIDLNMSTKEAKKVIATITPVYESDWPNSRLIIENTQNKYNSQDSETFVCIPPDRDNDLMNEIEMPRIGSITTYIDIGNLDSLKEDRLIEPLENSKFFKIIERRKFSRKIVITLPSNNHYASAMLPVPKLDASFVSPPMPSHLHTSPSLLMGSDKDIKDLFKKENSVRSSLDTFFVTAGFGIDGFKKGSKNPDQEFDRREAIQACCNMFNKAANNKEIYDTFMHNLSPSIDPSEVNECDSTTDTSASISYYDLKNQKNQPIPPSYDDAMNAPSTSTAGMLGYTSCDPIPPDDQPPPYSYNADKGEGTMFSSDQNSPISTSLGDGSPMDVSSAQCTPMVSPNVSDVSGDEGGAKSPMNIEVFTQVPQEQQCPSSYMDVEQQNAINNRKIRVMNARNEGDTLTAADIASCDSNNDSNTIVGGESTSGSTVTSGTAPAMPPQYHFTIVKIDESAEKPDLHLEIDTRQKTGYLKFWLASFLQLDPNSFQICKHFNDMEEGYPFNPEEAIMTDIVESKKLSVRILDANNTPTVKSTFITEHNRSGRKRERPLRIKIQSLSESAECDAVHSTSSPKITTNSPIKEDGGL